MNTASWTIPVRVDIMAQQSKRARPEIKAFKQKAFKGLTHHCPVLCPGSSTKSRTADANCESPVNVSCVGWGLETLPSTKSASSKAVKTCSRSTVFEIWCLLCPKRCILYTFTYCTPQNIKRNQNERHKERYIDFIVKTHLAKVSRSFVVSFRFF